MNDFIATGKNALSGNTRQNRVIYKALVQPYFYYCSPLWDNCGKLLKDKMQKFQSRVARVNYRSHL